MTLSWFIAKKRNYPRAERNYGLNDIATSFVKAFWALLVPVIILGGIYTGVFTPTEAAVSGVVYALLIGKFIYKELDATSIKAAFMDALVVNGATTFMLGLSLAFATYLTMEEIPMRVGEWIISVSSTPWIILLLINMMLLVVGCFVDNISSMIILTPIFLPVMRSIGVDPVHFGLFMTVALAIGFITPPYGANLFVASAVSGEKLDTISRNIFPMVFVMMFCLILFIYFPIFSMGLVNLLIRG
jgi:C4-dicarboxylate transporter DctM subunit